MDFRRVFPDRLGDFLEQSCLAGLRRRDNEASLSLADRCNQVDDPEGERALVAGRERNALVRKDRRHILEIRAPKLRRADAVYRIHIEQRAVALLFAAQALHTGHKVAGSQAKAPYLRGRHIDILLARQIICRAQKPETALAHNFQ